MAKLDCIDLYRMNNSISAHDWIYAGLHVFTLLRYDEAIKGLIWEMGQVNGVNAMMQFLDCEERGEWDDG